MNKEELDIVLGQVRTGTYSYVLTNNLCTYICI